MNYPRLLRPQPNFDIKTPSQLTTSFLIRETEINLYKYIDEHHFISNEDFNACSDEVLKEFLNYTNSSKEIFELSLYIFGTFTLEHLGLKLCSKEDVNKYLYVFWRPGVCIPEEDVPCTQSSNVFPVFFRAKDLTYHIDYFDKETSSEMSIEASFEHMPNLINYYHCQLFSNENNQKLSKQLGNKKYSRLARFLIKELFVKAVCLSSPI
ncbi:MAG: hypothetical protein IJ688_10435 [Treponema sp.]|nr:hypothetical protein [Treponema sp.]